MKVYCKKEDVVDDVEKYVEYCHEYSMGETSEGGSNQWESCVHIVQRVKSVIMGDKHTIFVMFTESGWNPYVIRTNNIEVVSKYLCDIKKKGEDE
jgi:hypothetical protein